VSFEVKVLDHPYIQAVLTVLRDRRTNQIEFRKSLVRIGRAIGYEIVRDFETEEVHVETPLGVVARGVRIKGYENIVIVTVLRAGMPMTEGLVKIFPAARQGVISARRVEEKGMTPDKRFEIEINYVKLPRIGSNDTVIVVDPMVATGSTMEAVLRILVNRGRAKKYIIAAVITTPIAVERLRKLAEKLSIDVRMYVASIDPELNEHGFIVPGLGDAGDRAFGG
jgi:uracil phosphoribosyltransferase